MIQQYKAFLFDLNGTMIDDMHYHVKAWYRIVNELGANLDYEQVKAECYGKNQELLERVFPGRFSDEEKDSISLEKEKQYQAEFKPHLQLIKGLDLVLDQAMENGIKLAIGSAAILYNIDFVVDGLELRSYFDAIVSADDVQLSKPDPETYLECARRLGLPAEQCVVFEDSPKGVEAAANAGMKAVVITTLDPKEAFSQYNNIVAFINDYTDLLIEDIVA